MVDICDVWDRWAEMSADERFFALQEWLMELADAWGFDISVTLGLPDDVDAWGAYVPAHNALYLSEPLFEDSGEGSGYVHATGIAAHELWHALQDAWVEEFGVDAEDAELMHEDTDADAFAELLLDEILESCFGETGAESSTVAGWEAGDWVLEPDDEAYA